MDLADATGDSEKSGGALPVGREFVRRCLACDGVGVAGSFAAPAQMVQPDDTFRFGTCADCELLYLMERVPSDELADYYDEHYLLHRGEAAWGIFAALVRLGRRRRDDRRVACLSRFVDLAVGDRVLDVGCGRPTFLTAMRERTGARAVGIDFRGDAFRNTPEFRGVELLSGDIRTVVLEGSFSAITMWHYLEHDYEPVSTLRSLLRHTRPETVLLIEVPDGRSRARRWAGARWAGLHTPRHTAVYTPSTLQRLLERSGWEVVASELPPTLDPWILWWLSWRERQGTDWTASMARYLPGFLFGKLLFGSLLRRVSSDVLLVAARPSK